MFDEHGFVGPVPLFTPRECRRLLPRLQSASTPPSWLKGQGASSPHFFALAREPRIVDRVARLIGDDVMLWGACLRRRAPGLAALAPLELARLATRRLVKVAPRALVELAPRRLRQAVRRFAV